MPPRSRDDRSRGTGGGTWQGKYYWWWDEWQEVWWQWNDSRQRWERYGSVRDAPAVADDNVDAGPGHHTAVADPNQDNGPGQDQQNQHNGPGQDQQAPDATVVDESTAVAGADAAFDLRFAPLCCGCYSRRVLRVEGWLRVRNLLGDISCECCWQAWFAENENRRANPRKWPFSGDTKSHRSRGPPPG